jgi:uncharacterized repeat protein (TIGR03803 family)
MKSKGLFAKVFLPAVSSVVAVTLMAGSPVIIAQSSSYQVIHNFIGTTGTFPVGNLITDASGNLYGVLAEDTNATGNCVATSGCGNVFKLYKTSSGGWAISQLHKFAGGKTDGDYPQGGLAFDSAGNLYGTTYAGGLYGQGIAYKLSPNSSGGWTYSVIYNFGASFAGGEGPQATLLVDATGNLYGSTISGGNTGGICASGCGVVFELSPSSSGTWTGTVLHSFTGTDGSWPRAPLIFDAVGNLYGTTQYGGDTSACGNGGCGTVFELSPNSTGGWTETVLYSFTGRTDGSLPFYSGVIFDAAGNLYGTTAGGGHNSQCNGGCGVVFKLSPNGSAGWTETAIHSFTGKSGYPDYGGGWPESSLTSDASGNLYGATYWGGKGGGTGDGVVFKLSPNSSGGWDEVVLHAFAGGAGGAFPYHTGVTFGSGGYLHGMTLGGGNLTDCSGGCGTVYEVMP